MVDPYIYFVDVKKQKLTRQEYISGPSNSSGLSSSGVHFIEYCLVSTVLVKYSLGPKQNSKVKPIGSSCSWTEKNYIYHVIIYNHIIASGLRVFNKRQVKLILYIIERHIMEQILWGSKLYNIPIGDICQNSSLPLQFSHSI